MTLLASALPPDQRSWSVPPAAHSTVCVCEWGGGRDGGGEWYMQLEEGLHVITHMLGYLALQ